MAASSARSLARLLTTRRSFSSKVHEFSEPSSLIGSWDPPKDPKEAEARLARLRREYKKQLKEVRNVYIKDVEIMRIEKQRKDDARREALRVLNEERKKLKAEAAQIRAQEIKLAQEELRETLLKARADKLENWRMKESKREENRKEKSELLRQQSALWIDQPELEKKILEAIVNITPL